MTDHLAEATQLSQPELVLAISRQPLFAHNGIISPIPYPILEAISEEPVFCSQSTIENAVDLAQVQVLTLVTNSSGQIQTTSTGRIPEPHSIDINVSSHDRPLLAAIRDQVSKGLGLSDEEPRRPAIIALLHEPSAAKFAKAVVLIYHFQSTAEEGTWHTPEELHQDDRLWLPALEHVP